MNPYGASQNDLPPLRREDRYRTEIHRRAALPFHHTASPRASHDLLVMNQRPDLAPFASLELMADPAPGS
jgi:hypothetical protein